MRQIPGGFEDGIAPLTGLANGKRNSQSLQPSTLPAAPM